MRRLMIEAQAGDQQALEALAIEAQRRHDTKALSWIVKQDPTLGRRIASRLIRAGASFSLYTMSRAAGDWAGWPNGRGLLDLDHLDPDIVVSGVVVPSAWSRERMMRFGLDCALRCASALGRRVRNLAQVIDDLRQVWIGLRDGFDMSGSLSVARLVEAHSSNPSTYGPVAEVQAARVIHSAAGAVRWGHRGDAGGWLWQASEHSCGALRWHDLSPDRGIDELHGRSDASESNRRLDRERAWQHDRVLAYLLDEVVEPARPFVEGT